MPSDEDFDGSVTSRFPAEEMRRFELTQKLPSVVVLLGSDLGMRVPLTKPEVTFGRTTDADVLLHDEQISRKHVLIRYSEEKQTYFVVDLNSTNGTLLNNQRVTESALKDGDKIFLGSTVLRFTLDDPLEAEHLDELNRLVFTDDLTGLVIKRRFYDQLRFKIQQAISKRETISLLMMDLDGLKGINDVHGHAMGAYIISQAGKMIGEIVNPLGAASRYGGDEFVAHLPNHDLAKALEVGARVCEAIRSHVFLKDGKSLRLSISIGAATLTTAIRELEKLNQAADEALYRAKAKGRNCVSD